MKHILFLSYDGMTDPLGQSQVIPYLKGLTVYGYRFTILSCDKPGKYEEGKKTVEDTLKGFPISWHSIPYHKFPPVLSSIYDLAKIKQSIKRLHEQTPFHMVHTRPGLPTLAALWMKKKYGVKFLNDIRGFWADERVDGGMWDLSNPVYKRVYKFFKKHEDECIRQANHNVCLTYAAEKVILSWKHLPVDKNSITVIPCSADPGLFDPLKVSDEEKNNLKNNLQIKDHDIVFSYLGSIGGWYLIKEMMRFYKIIADKIPQAKFLFISPHRHKDILNAAVENGINENRIILTNARRNEVPVLLSLSDYSVFFIKPCFSKLSSSPTKHGEIMFMGIPVITNSGVGDVAEIISKYEAGFVINEFSDQAFHDLADKIITGKKFNRENIRNAAAEFYSLENAVNKYAGVYNKILGISHNETK